MRPLPRQRGAAIVTAMLVVTLAAVMTSALFYRQSVSVRSIENRLALSQTRWVERAAIDWAKVILRSDTGNTDHAEDVWGTPVVETRLDETVTGGARVGDAGGDAFLAGAVVDAQSRFNLTSLLTREGAASAPHILALRKLMGLLDLPESLVDRIVLRLQQSRNQVVEGRQIPALSLRLMHVDDLLDLPGFDERTLQVLRPHVIVLPEITTVNVNTASAEVIASLGEDITLGQARSFVQMRDRAAVAGVAQANQIMGLPGDNGIKSQLAAGNTRYFIVQGAIRYDRVESRTETLLRRDGTGPRGKVQVIWQARI